ncbi:MAG: hypothetical protein K0Q95_3261 [Bacteroidota bacterium]|jgi:hypothetical protein|nr:hypothetical protein [Bacteroidota bacterium]
MKAYKLININKTESSFIEGEVPDLIHIDADHFFAQKDIGNLELTLHPAPRYQFVVTLKGKLKFTVSNGDSFIIEPGILLIAKDLEGPGHSWDIIDGEIWERIYIVMKNDGDDHFVAMKR